MLPHAHLRSCDGKAKMCQEPHSDIQEEEQHAAEELADVLGQLAHHAWSPLSSFAQCHQELCSELPDTFRELGGLGHLQQGPQRVQNNRQNET